MAQVVDAQAAAQREREDAKEELRQATLAYNRSVIRLDHAKRVYMMCFQAREDLAYRPTKLT